jgi:hypothetical protein
VDAFVLKIIQGYNSELEQINKVKYKSELGRTNSKLFHYKSLHEHRHEWIKILLTFGVESTSSS